MEDASNDISGFRNDNTGSDDYSYDYFGNLREDRNKHVLSAKYNYMNLPNKLTLTGLNAIEYLYDASGRKLLKTVKADTTTGVVITETAYQDGFQYEDGVIQFFPTSEGYVKATDSNGELHYNYVYQYKDHLGNIRMNYGIDPDDQVLKILHEDHYYPFGLKHRNYNPERRDFKQDPGENLQIKPLPAGDENPYRYKYNGKEWQDELGLNVYALDWRQYDPAIGRFMTIDPETDEDEQLDKSPYAFAWNNPVLNSDPDGRNPIKGLLRALKNFAKEGTPYVARTSKGELKRVSKTSAQKMLQNGKTVIKTTDGSSNKVAKRMMESASDGKKVVRHDGHDLVNSQGEKTGKKGLDHFQKQSGDGSHVLYDNGKKTGVAVGAARGAEASDSATKDNAKEAVSFGATMTDFVENIGTKVFGNSDFGKGLNELNPLNLGFSDLFKAMDNSLNKKH